MKPGSSKSTRSKSGRSKKKAAVVKGDSALDVIKRHSTNAGPLFQKLLSAMILEDGMEEFDDDVHEIGRRDDGYADSEVQVLVGVSSHAQYEQMCLDDRLVLELQSVGLYVQTVNGPSEKYQGPLGGAVIRGGGAKGKRSQRARKGNAKPKPKQTLSVSGNGVMEVPSPASASAAADVPKMATEIPMQGELGSDLGGNHDLSSWFDFDDEGLEEDDSVGLDIPMDDLSKLMF